MTSDQIRAIAPGQSGADLLGHAGSNQTDALLLCGAMLQEIAAQLADFNAKLEPARLVAAIEEVQAKIDERDRGPR